MPNLSTLFWLHPKELYPWRSKPFLKPSTSKPSGSNSLGHFAKQIVGLYYPAAIASGKCKRYCYDNANITKKMHHTLDKLFLEKNIFADSYVNQSQFANTTSTRIVFYLVKKNVCMKLVTQVHLNFKFVDEDLFFHDFNPRGKSDSTKKLREIPKKIFELKDNHNLALQLRAFSLHNWQKYYLLFMV